MKKGIMFMLVIALVMSVMSVSALTVTPSTPGAKVDGSSSTDYYVLSNPTVKVDFTLGTTSGEAKDNVSSISCQVISDDGITSETIDGTWGSNEIEFTIVPFERKVINWNVTCDYTYDNGTANVSRTKTSSQVTNYVTDQKLLITEVDVDYESQSRSSTSSKTEKFYLDDLYSEDLSVSSIALVEDVTVELTVANLLLEEDYDERSDAEMSDLELDFEPDETSYFDEDNFDFDDIRGISSTGSVRTKSVEVTLSAPIDILSDSTSESFLFGFTVLGVDYDDNEYEEFLSLELGFTKQGDKIYLNKGYFVNPEISCDDSAQMRLEFMNAGRSDEDEVMMYVYNKDLDYTYVEKDISMDADTSESQERSLTVDIPEDVKPGTYLFTVEFFTDNSESKPVDDSQYYVELDVSKCVKETAPETTTPDKTDNNDSSDIVVDKSDSDVLDGYQPVVVDTSNSNKEESKDVLLIVGLAGLNVVLLLVGVFLIMRIVRK